MRDSQKRISSPTIYDIAKLAGFDASTVSRALTSPGRLNKQTEEKIKSAAKTLNYRVNNFARALPTGKTKMIALFLTDITNPVFFNAVRGAELAAADHGYILVIAESQESEVIEAEAIRRILPSVDGCILISTRLSDHEIRQLNAQKPIVLLNKKVPGIVDTVPSSSAAISDVVKHLASLHHSRIAFVAGPANSWMDKERTRLIKKHVTANDMHVSVFGPHEPTLKGGQAALTEVLESGVSAVVAYNDLMAIGLMNEAKKQGISIPGDLSLVGFDNVFGSDFTTPQLSTVEIQQEVSGRDGMNALIEILDSTGEPSIAPRSSQKARFLIRESTGPAG